MSSDKIWLGQAINLATAECLHKGKEEDFKAFLICLIKHYQRIEIVQGTSIKQIAELIDRKDILLEIDSLNQRLK